MTWGQVASADQPRYMQPVRPASRRRCSCGCGARATQLGMAGGMALMQGCELFVRRWVRDGPRARNPRRAGPSGQG